MLVYQRVYYIIMLASGFVGFDHPDPGHPGQMCVSWIPFGTSLEDESIEIHPTDVIPISGWISNIAGLVM